MKLLLIRHPRPDVEQGLCYGRLDVAPAEPETTELIERLARRTTPGRVYSSPLQRCRKVALAMSERHLWPAPIFDDRLREMDFGQWEGQRWTDLPRASIAAWSADMTDLAPPGGESVRALAGRADAFARELITSWFGDPHDPSQPMPPIEIAIITHAGIIQTMPRMLRNEPLSGFAASRVEYGSITELEHRHGAFHHVGRS